MTLTYRRDLTRKLTTEELDGNFDHVIDSANQTFLQSGIAASDAEARTVNEKLSEVEVSLKDFPVVFDDSTDNSTALQAQLDKGPGVEFAVPVGIARFATGLTWTDHRVRLYGKAPPIRGNQTDAGPCLKYTGTGTGLLLGVNPGGAGTFLEEAQIENLRLKVGTTTAIALRLYMLLGGRLSNVFVYGNSGSRTGIKVEGCIDTELFGLDVQGHEGAAGVPANYLQYGVEMINGFGGSPTTTTTFRKCYLHYCLFGLSTSGFSICEDSIFESNTTGVQVGTNANATFNRCWWKANLGADVYFGSASRTIIENAHSINSGARETFFDGNVPDLVVLRNCNLSTTHVAPRMFNKSGSLLTGVRIVLDNNILPAAFTINGPYTSADVGNGINWKNIQVVGMRQSVYRFRQTAVAATTTYTMPQDNGSANAAPMPEKGHILATYCYYVGATITAGSFTTKLLKNGSAVSNFTSDASGGPGAFSTTPGEVNGIHYRDKFAAGDTLQPQVITDSSFLATGGEFITEVIVAFGEDGMA